MSVVLIAGPERRPAVRRCRASVLRVVAGLIRLDAALLSLTAIWALRWAWLLTTPQLAPAGPSWADRENRPHQMRPRASEPPPPVAGGGSGTVVGATLPRCEDFASRLPGSDLFGGTPLISVDAAVSWVLRSDGSREISLPRTCRLKRYVSSESRRCLAGKRVVFIGDSVTRYQVLSLAYFLETGSFPPRFGLAGSGRPGACGHIDESGAPTCDSRPSVCIEREWESWDEFLRGLGGGDDGGVFRGRMECQCHDAGDAKDRVGNMRYVAATDAKSEGRPSVEMTFISETGWGDNPEAVRGFETSGCADRGDCRLTPEDQSHLRDRGADYKEPLVDALDESGSLRRQFPDINVAIYNRGHWGALKKDRADRIFPLLRDWVGDKGQCYFKGTTGSARLKPESAAEERVAQRAAMDAGCGVIDLAHATKEFGQMPIKRDGRKFVMSKEREDVYWDAVHFMPWVYEELNQLLLNILCNAELSSH